MEPVRGIILVSLTSIGASSFGLSSSLIKVSVAVSASAAFNWSKVKNSGSSENLLRISLTYCSGSGLLRIYLTASGVTNVPCEVISCKTRFSISRHMG